MERLPAKVKGWFPTTCWEAGTVGFVDVRRRRERPGENYPSERPTVPRELHVPTDLLRGSAPEEIAHRLDRRGNGGKARCCKRRPCRGLFSRAPGRNCAKGSRFADRFPNAPWYAVYIQTPREEITALPHNAAAISNTLRWCKLGSVPMIQGTTW